MSRANDSAYSLKTSVSGIEGLINHVVSIPVMKARITAPPSDGHIHIHAIPAGLLTAPDELGDDVDRTLVSGGEAVVQRCFRVDILRQQHGECAHQFRRPVEPIGDRGDFCDQIAGPVRMSVVIGVADVERGVVKAVPGVGGCAGRRG